MCTDGDINDTCQKWNWFSFLLLTQLFYVGKIAGLDFVNDAFADCYMKPTSGTPVIKPLILQFIKPPLTFVCLKEHSFYGT